MSEVSERIEWIVYATPEQVRARIHAVADDLGLHAYLSAVFAEEHTRFAVGVVATLGTRGARALTRGAGQRRHDHQTSGQRDPRP
jgi:hypothetical protein